MLWHRYLTPSLAALAAQVQRFAPIMPEGGYTYYHIWQVQRFAPIMPEGGSILALSFLAAERFVPGYGGGMSSAKAQLESDMRVLSFEIGRQYGLRIARCWPGGC